jgi:hypothetical protein
MTARRHALQEVAEMLLGSAIEVICFYSYKRQTGLKLIIGLGEFFTVLTVSPRARARARESLNLAELNSVSLY